MKDDERVNVWVDGRKKTGREGAKEEERRGKEDFFLLFRLLFGSCSR
jgi:hypothetical protein